MEEIIASVPFCTPTPFKMVSKIIMEAIKLRESKARKIIVRKKKEEIKIPKEEVKILETFSTKKVHMRKEVVEAWLRDLQ